jgi:hypothetical protein
MTYDAFSQEDLLEKNKFKENCRTCDFPVILKSKSDKNFDFLFDVKFKSGETLTNCKSVSRIMFQNLGREEQGAKIEYLYNGSCKDTIIMASKIKELRYGDIGSAGQPLILPFLPARIFYREQGNIDIPGSFLDISGFLSYGGGYDNPNNRNVGFSSFFYGLDVLYNPFNNELGDNLSFAIGAEVLLEGGRLRLPLFGHLRYKFLAKQKILERVDNFVPSICKIRYPADTILSPNDFIAKKDVHFIEIPQNSEVLDSSVYFVREKEIISPKLRPYLFIEGGPIFNSSFEGAGNENVINPDLYGQYFIGAGIGTTFGNYLQASLSYRFTRLNLKTICKPCASDWVQNADESHSILLKIGIYLNY